MDEKFKVLLVPRLQFEAPVWSEANPQSETRPQSEASDQGKTIQGYCLRQVIVNLMNFMIANLWIAILLCLNYIATRRIGGSNVEDFQF